MKCASEDDGHGRVTANTKVLGSLLCRYGIVLRPQSREDKSNPIYALRKKLQWATVGFRWTIEGLKMGLNGVSVRVSVKLL